MQITNSENSSFKDLRDGNIYRTVKIGNQVWMAENLRYAIDGSYSYANIRHGGRLYTWDAAVVASPPGWLLPSSADWEELVSNVGSPAATKLKSTEGWNGDGNGTDEFGFSALPMGERNEEGNPQDAGDDGYWWTSTEHDTDKHNAYRIIISCVRTDPGFYKKILGCSVRCVKG